MRAHRGLLLRLGRLYTQIEAPVGPFGLATLKASTRALASQSAGDAAYARTERQLRQLGAERDAIGALMRSALLGAAFAGHPIDVPAARHLIQEARQLLRLAAALKG